MLGSRLGAHVGRRLSSALTRPSATLSTAAAGGASVGKRSFAPIERDSDGAEGPAHPAHFAMPPWEPVRELDPATMTAKRMRRECIDEKQPAVFRGVAADWPAVSGPRAWSDWDRLGAAYGHQLVSVEQGTVFYSPDALAGVRVPFGLYLVYMHRAAEPEVLAQMHRELRPMYLGQSDLFADVPEMKDDVTLPEFA